MFSSIIKLEIMLISLLVGWHLKSAFRKYSELPLRSGLTGEQVALKMLRDNGIYDVTVTSVSGMLTDHYNPLNKTINLSEGVFASNSIAAAAIAAHETGHAVQHAVKYPFLQMRSKLVPVTIVANRIMGFVMMFAIFGGMFMHMFNGSMMLYIIIAAQAAITIFSLITLPVEFDASKRGLVWLENAGLTSGEEHTKAKHALRLAATTYIVAALSAVTMLLYFVLRLVGGRD
jgi:Zn-dependent membrane protease YugP